MDWAAISPPRCLGREQWGRHSKLNAWGFPNMGQTFYSLSKHFSTTGLHSEEKQVSKTIQQRGGRRCLDLLLLTGSDFSYHWRLPQRVSCKYGYQIISRTATNSYLSLQLSQAPLNEIFLFHRKKAKWQHWFEWKNWSITTNIELSKTASPADTPPALIHRRHPRKLFLLHWAQRNLQHQLYTVGSFSLQ